jgi:hypothetical protein
LQSQRVSSAGQLALACACLVAGCIAPDLEQISTLECLSPDECPAGSTCVDGACVGCGDEELCDGFDNDCDGATDEDFDFLTDAEHCGGCGVTCETFCRDAACFEIPDGVDCTPSVTGEELCNGGIDDDCDGNADEGFAVGQACEVGVGVCRATGTTVCGPDGSLVCDAEARPGVDERCDGADNDCDGTTDEGFALGEPCEVGEGACRAEGMTVCGADGDVTCDAEPRATGDEICNGGDDDCDGNTDEGFDVGAECDAGEGACARAGAIACNPDGTAACDATPGEPEDETCNDLDDDCDGNTDEDFPVGVECSVGESDCVATGRIVCNPVGGLRCDAEPREPEPEICADMVDNDCDGNTDEGFEDLGAACDNGGVGECLRVGTLECGPPDPTRLACSATPVDPAEEICDLLDNDCDGTPDEDFDLQSDVAHCGACNSPCDLANATPACNGGQCVIEACDEGFEDFDRRVATGCECNRENVDEPDPAFIDTNCDNVDGDAEESIFVSADFGDDVDGAGTPQAPFRTIGRALLAAAGSPILVDRGAYPLPGGVRLQGTVRIHGGYAYDQERGVWGRNRSNDGEPTILTGPGDVDAPLITVADGADVLLDNLRIERDDAAVGQSAIAMATEVCGGLQLVDVRVLSGRGGDGVPGEDGASTPDEGTLGLGGTNGFAGPPGINPNCVLANGGQGGNGAVDDMDSADDGRAGSAPPGLEPAPGGAGGSEPLDINAEDGRDGPGGVPGENGEAPISVGGVLADPPRIDVPIGTIGTSGTAGGGGGGGGGGRNGWPTELGGPRAPGGGGGGAGGCGGAPGRPGGPGGSSVGLLIVAGCDVQLVRSQIEAGVGGDGGSGGDAARGGPGKRGGQPQDASTGRGPAGQGGRGGDGGCGGNAPGGTGGASLAVLLLGDATIEADPASALRSSRAGTAGAGGDGCPGEVEAAADGLPGLRAETGCCEVRADCVDFACPAAPDMMMVDPDR